MRKESDNNRSFLRSWGAVYALMAGVLVLVIVALYIFTQYFR